MRKLRSSLKNIYPPRTHENTLEVTDNEGLLILLLFNQQFSFYPVCCSSWFLEMLVRIGRTLNKSN